MILWKDFVLDGAVGPLLTFPEELLELCDTECREKRLGSPSVMEDAIGTNEMPEGISIQETRQEQRPARMVGLSSLDFVQTGKEASRSNRAQPSRRRGDA